MLLVPYLIIGLVFFQSIVLNNALSASERNQLWLFFFKQVHEIRSAPKETNLGRIDKDRGNGWQKILAKK